MKDLVEKLLEILESGKVNDTDISSIHTLAEDYYFSFNDDNIINNPFKSNVITCAMLLVRNPKLIGNVHFLSWINAAIDMYEYFYRGSLSRHRPFNLSDALCISVLYEYTKNRFIDDDIFEHLRNRDYDKLFLFDYGKEPRDPNINTKVKALHFAQYLYAFVYNSEKIGIKATDIANILGINFYAIRQAKLYGEPFGEKRSLKNLYNLMYNLIDLIKDIDNLDYNNQIYKLFYFHIPRCRPEMDEFLFALARHDFSKVLSEDLETLLVERIKAKIKADKEAEEAKEKEKQKMIETKKQIFSSIYDYVLERANMSTATRTYNVIMRKIVNDSEITDVLEFFRSNKCYDVYGLGKKNIVLIRQYLGIIPEHVADSNTTEEVVEPVVEVPSDTSSLGRRNHHLFLKNLNIFKKYIYEQHCLPTNYTEYEGMKLGSWVNNQVNSYKKGKLPELWLRLLNEVNPYWNGTEEEKKEENKRLLLSSNWQSKVPIGETPIDDLCDDKLYYCLKNGIYSYESLFDRKEYELIDLSIYEVVAKIVKIIDPDYTRLFCAIRGLSISKDGLEVSISEFNELCIKSSEEMVQKMNQMISTLTEREQRTIRLRFGFEDGECKTLRECAKIFGIISQDRVRQIEAKAIRKLRHPSRLKLLYSTNTVLDEISMERSVKAKLYRMDITSKDKLVVFYDFVNEDLKEAIYNYLHPVVTETEYENKMDTPFEELGLSVRAYNCIRRYFLNKYQRLDITVGDVVELMKNTDELMKVRNLGKHTLEEIFKVVNDFLGIVMVPNLN